MKLKMLLVLVVALGTGTAHATTIDFAFSNGTTEIAAGSFAFADGASGVLHYADLSAFSIHFDAQNTTYDLSFAESAPQFSYFGYDTSTGQFVAANIAGIHELLGAINAGLT